MSCPYVYSVHPTTGSLVVEHSFRVWEVLGLIPSQTKDLKLVVEASLSHVRHIKGVQRKN